ncbi:MAG: carbon-nitrogen hydrolase [Balneolaceae bacterium]|nr:carbon-nitrogen hydrolase [Balneolaceae bacterium]
MDTNTVKLGLIQLACTEDLENNLSEAVRRVRKAAAEGAQIVCLQELFNTPYFCREMNERYFDWAEPIPGPTVSLMAELAGSLGIVLLVPLFERRAAGIYHNSLAVINADGTLMGIYRKKHIPDDPGFYEKYYFTPGEDTYAVFDTKYGAVAPLICWDQWYPEAARIAALNGAEILVYPTAIGTLPDEGGPKGREYREAWQTIQRSHAIANGCYVASVNRVGTEGEVTFWGHSFVAGPFGQLVGRAGGNEEVMVVEVDLAKIEKQRQVWPFFRDRRIDTYSPILKRFDD